MRAQKLTFSKNKKDFQGNKGVTDYASRANAHEHAIVEFPWSKHTSSSSEDAIAQEQFMLLLSLHLK